MMKKNIKWLLAEIDLWLNEELITPDQAENIKHRYQVSDQGPAWGRIIFFSIGAVLFGLGVILLFAYNWEKMHKFAKLAVIVLALLTGHGTGFWLRQPAGRYRSAGEGLHLTGTMLFGAGIWLVAQIYHIDEHYPNAFFIWGFGAMTLAWALPSISHAILATVLLVLWNGCEALDFKNPQLLSPFILLAGLLPLAWAYRSRVLLATTTGAFMLIVTGCKKLDIKSTTAGCLLVASISLARYTDLFVSLLARSSVFLLMGAALFAVGLYYSRTKKQLQEKTT